MEFEFPSDKGFTVYSKSGCPNCIKVKNLLKEQKLTFNIVDCDELLIQDKENFLNVIRELSQYEVKQFPIIFHERKFIGGYNEIKSYIEKIVLSFEENLNF